MNNKLYCTFVQEETVDGVVGQILEEHNIIFNKIFVLISPEGDKTMLTYNIDGPVHNLQLPNTILVHRKKQTNTLYTINALNVAILSFTLPPGFMNSHLPQTVYSPIVMGIKGVLPTKFDNLITFIYY